MSKKAVLLVNPESLYALAGRVYSAVAAHVELTEVSHLPGGTWNYQVVVIVSLDGDRYEAAVKQRNPQTRVIRLRPSNVPTIPALREQIMG